MLTARNIGVTLGGAGILRGIGYSAAPGKVSAIAGPNGSGKTTLLRALTGEIAADGDITLNGRSIAGMPPRELAGMRGVLPQSTALAFPFNVIEVVRLGAGARSAHLAGAALARVGLAGFESRFYQDLSGGEKQRVQLARVLAQIWQPVQDGVPRWLFLDEPVAALDIGHQLQVMRIARDFARGGGGVVAVMHDLNLTAMFADQLTLLRDGKRLGHGPVAEVMTGDILSRAYGCRLMPGEAPESGLFVLPQTAA